MGAFDDLIPDAAGATGVFDDLIPDAAQARGSFADLLPDEPPATEDFDSNVAWAQTKFQLSKPEAVRMVAERFKRNIPENPTAFEAFKGTMGELPGEAVKSAVRTSLTAPLRFVSRVNAQNSLNTNPEHTAGPLERFANAVDSSAELAYPAPERPGLEHSVAQGVGQVGTMLGGGAALKVLGASPAVTAAGITVGAGVAEFDDAFGRAIERGDNADTAFAKSLGYATIAALIENRMGAGRLWRQMFPSAELAAKKLTALGVSRAVGANVLAGGLEEGSQRAAQNLIVDGKPSMEGVMEEAIPGAIIEGAMGLPVSVGNRIQQGQQFNAEKQLLEDSANRIALEQSVPLANNGRLTVNRGADESFTRGAFDDLIPQSQSPVAPENSESSKNQTPAAAQATSPAAGAAQQQQAQVRQELEALPGADQDLMRKAPALTTEQTDAGLREQPATDDNVPATKADLKALADFISKGGPNPFADKPTDLKGGVSSEETQRQGQAVLNQATPEQASGVVPAKQKPASAAATTAAAQIPTNRQAVAAPQGNAPSAVKPDFVAPETPAAAKIEIKNGDTVSVVTRKGAKPRAARVLQLQPDGSAQVVVAGEQTARWLTKDQITPSRRAVTQQAKADELAGFAPEHQTQIKQRAAEFRQLVEDYAPQLEWTPAEAYDESFGTDTKDVGFRKAELRTNAIRQAMRAVFPNGQENSQVDQANALPALERYLKEKFPGDNSVAKRRTLEQFSRSETSPEQTATVERDQAVLKELAARYPGKPFLQGLRAVGRSSAGGQSKLDGQSGGKSSSKGALSAAGASAITELERIFGVRIIFVQDAKFAGVKPAGVKLILINTKAKAPMMALAGHELLHHIASTHPGLYADFKRGAVALLKNDAQFRAQLERNGYANLTDDVVTEEMFADVLGDAVLDPRFLQQLAKSEPNLFKRFARTAVKWLEKLIAKAKAMTGFDSAQYVTDLTEMRERLLNLLRDAGRQTQFDRAGIEADAGQSEDTEQGQDAFARQIERPASAAIRDKKTGEIWHGQPVHGLLHDQIPNIKSRDLEAGFATKAGRFITAAEAERIAGIASGEELFEMSADEVKDVFAARREVTQYDSDLNPEQRAQRIKELNEQEKRAVAFKVQQRDQFSGQRMEFSNATITAPGLVDLGDRFSLTAHHGTPHKVDKFTTAKIGTGEGAQVYGWGLYFAENPAVAEVYKETLSRQYPTKIEYKGKKLSPDERLQRENDYKLITPEEKAAIMVGHFGKDGAIERLTSDRDYIRQASPYDLQVDNPTFDKAASLKWLDESIAAVADIKAADIKVEKPGATYTVELNADPEDLLDWDEPLMGQSDKVKSILQREGITLNGTRESYSGQALYNALQESRGVAAGDNLPDWMSGETIYSPKAASKFLAERGIKGIRFLDQGSRNLPTRFTDSAHVAAAKSCKDSGMDADDARRALVKAYKTASYGELNNAVEQVYGITPAPTYNYVIFSDDDITITHENGQEVGARDMFSLEGGDMFGFDAPESVAEQKAREKREAETQKLKKAKDAMQERAGARLIGKDLDTTQEMFGGEVKRDKTGQGDMFSREAEQSEFARVQADITAAEAELMAAIRQHMNPPPGMRKAEALEAKNAAASKLNRLIAQQLKLMTSANVDAQRSPEQTADMIGQTVDLLNSIQDEISERTAKSQEVPADLTKLRQDLQTRLNLLKGWSDDQTDEAAQGAKPERAKPETAAARGKFAEIESATDPERSTWGEWWQKLKYALRYLTSPIPELPLTGPRAQTSALFRRGYRLFAVENDRVQKEAADKVNKVLEPLTKLGRDPQDNAALRQYFRLGEALQRAKMDPAKTKLIQEQMAKLEERLNKDPFNLFRRLVLYRDLWWRGTYLKTEDGKPITLPMGLTVDEVQGQLRKLTAAIATHKDGLAITEALRRHYALTKELQESIKQHGEIIPESLNNPLYFPHHIIDAWTGRVDRVKAKTEEDFRSYLIAPQGSGKLIQTDYLKAMYLHTADVLAHNARVDLVQKYWQPYDISEQLKAQHGAAWNKPWNIPPGYKLFTPFKKLPLRMDYILSREVLADKLGVLFNDGDLRERLGEKGMVLKIKPEDLHAAMVAGEKIQWALPEEIADALNGIAKREAQQFNLLHTVLTPARKLQTFWKIGKLFLPTNWIRYEYGNLSTDAIDKVLAADPGAVKHLARAAREIWNGDQGEQSPEFKAAAREGVFDTVTAGEAGDLMKLPAFQEFLTPGEKKLEAVKRILGAPARGSKFRESVFRYANFLANLERLRAGKEPVYAGAFHGDIEALGEDVDGQRRLLEGEELLYAKAAEISLKTFGDYASISAGGQLIRQYAIPFWSWQDVNFRYHANQLRNLADGLMGKSGDVGTARKAALRYAGLRVVSTLVAVGIAKELWNQFGGPALGLWDDDDDLEAKLSEQDRRRGHLLMGKDSKGQAIVIYTPSAWSDVAEWMGGQNMKRLFMEFARGKITLGQWISDYAKQLPADAANKLGQSIGPNWKTPYEFLSGKATFPDIFDQRSIAETDRWWRLVGNMTDDRIVNALRNVFDQDYYSQPASEQLQQIILQMRRRDFEQWAYYETREDASDWKEAKTGKKFEQGSYDAPEAQALRNFRKAIYRGDVANAARFYARLLEFGYTAERLDASIRNQAPLADLNESERAAYVKTLTPKQRQELELATKYYNRLKALDGREKQLFPKKGQPAKPNPELLKRIVEEQKR